MYTTEAAIPLAVKAASFLAAKSMKRTMLESQLDKWQFWYKRLGLPMDSVAEGEGEPEQSSPFPGTGTLAGGF